MELCYPAYLLANSSFTIHNENTIAIAIVPSALTVAIIDIFSPPKRIKIKTTP
jgi:hypothetical protein